MDKGDRVAAALAAELRVLSSLHHPRLVTLMCICRDPSPAEGSVALVMEYMPDGSLYRILHESSSSDVERKLGPSSSISTRLRVALDIAEGMRFLHHSRIIHRDLKSGNVLLGDNGRAKIIDFGLSAIRDIATSRVTGLVATAAWSAPEAIRGEQIRQKSDVYSFGVILWELFTGLMPWQGLTLMQIMSAVGMQGRRLEVPPTTSRSLSTDTRTLIASCFEDEAARPSFDAIVELLGSQYLAAAREEHRILKECPDEYLCPIGLEPMVDPVICADGHTYERANIEAWLVAHNTSTKTNVDLLNRMLHPNHTLRSIIASFRESSRTAP